MNNHKNNPDSFISAYRKITYDFIIYFETFFELYKKLMPEIVEKDFGKSTPLNIEEKNFLNEHFICFFSVSILRDIKDKPFKLNENKSYWKRYLKGKETLKEFKLRQIEETYNPGCEEIFYDHIESNLFTLVKIMTGL